MDDAKRIDPNRLYNEREAAELLSISHRSLQGWRQRGGGGPPYIKCGRSIRYRRGDMDAWCNQNRRLTIMDQPEGL